MSQGAYAACTNGGAYLLCRSNADCTDAGSDAGVCRPYAVTGIAHLQGDVIGVCE